jgi:hypothetical protein
VLAVVGVTLLSGVAQAAVAFLGVLVFVIASAVPEDAGEGRDHLDLPGLLTEVDGIAGTYFANRKP